MTRLPLTVEEAVERKPFPSVESPVTLSAPFPVMLPKVEFPAVKAVAKRLVELAVEAKEAVVVAFVVVEFPTMTRLPLTVDEADERKPPVRVARPVTLKVDESVEAPPTERVPFVEMLPFVVVVALPPIQRFEATERLVVEALPKVVRPVTESDEERVAAPETPKVPKIDKFPAVRP